MLRNGRVGLQFERMTELRFRFLQFALLNRCSCFRNIEFSILVALVGRGEFSSFPNLCGSLLLLAASSQCQAQLVVSLAARRVQACCFSKFSDRIADLAVV
jgi:hypothetical protein